MHVKKMKLCVPHLNAVNKNRVAGETLPFSSARKSFYIWEDRNILTVKGKARYNNTRQISTEGRGSVYANSSTE